MSNLLMIKVQDINITASQQEGDVEPELMLCDYRRGQKDTYFSGRANLLKLREAIDHALSGKVSEEESLLDKCLRLMDEFGDAKHELAHCADHGNGREEWESCLSEVKKSRETLTEAIRQLANSSKE